MQLDSQAFWANPHSQIDSVREPLARQLSVFGLWLLIANGMIGAGIFGLPAQAARLSGSFSPGVFVICGVLSFPIVLCFAELASYFKTTADRFFTARLLSAPRWAFKPTGSVHRPRPAASGRFVRVASLFSICGGLALVNLKGIRGAMTWLGVLTVLKSLPLLVLIGVGFVRMGSTASAIDAATPHDFGAAILLVA